MILLLLYLPNILLFKIIERIRPICLPTAEKIFSEGYIGQHPIVAGWGAVDWGRAGSEVLLYVDLPVIDNTACEELYERSGLSRSFDERSICAGCVNGEKDSCTGDSGGPLMMPHWLDDGKLAVYQIGIVSYGIACALENIAAIYTNVGYFMTWVRQVIKNTTTTLPNKKYKPHH